MERKKVQGRSGFFLFSSPPPPSVQGFSVPISFDSQMRAQRNARFSRKKFEAGEQAESR